jgi:prevent-host-death family protein
MAEKSVLHSANSLVELVLHRLFSFWHDFPGVLKLPQKELLTIRTDCVYILDMKDMKTVSVAVLKQQLSSYLHSVESGEDVVVTSHQRPVARMMALNAPSAQIRSPSRKPAVLRKLRGVRLAAGRSVVEILTEDRSRR